MFSGKKKIWMALALPMVLSTMMLSCSRAEQKTHVPQRQSFQEKDHAFRTTKYDVNLLYKVLEKQIRRSSMTAAKQDSLNMASVYFAWNWSYYATAAINGYKASKDVKFLRLVSNSFEQIIRYRDDNRGRKDHFQQEFLKSWGHQREGDAHWWNEVTMPGRITTPICLFLLEIKKDCSLMAQFQKEYEVYSGIVEEAIDAGLLHYRVNQKNEGYFVCPNKENQVEALNHSHCLGVTIALMYELTGRRHYKTVVEQMMAYFRSHINQIDGQPTWPYIPYEDQEDLKPEYARKAAVTIQFPYYAFKVGIIEDASEMSSYVQLFKRSVFNEGVFSSTTNPRKGFFDPEPISADIIAFIYLAEFDREVLSILNREIETNTTGLYDKGWFSDRISVWAYSYCGIL